LRCKRDINFRENFTVNFFARFSYRAASGNAVDDFHCRSTRLTLVKDTLESFFFPALSNRWSEVCRCCARWANGAISKYQINKLPFENVSREGRGDQTWIHSGDEVGGLTSRVVREDQILYDSWLRG
jgi:hypothetical protein